jgi:hypothetical protein
MTCACAEGAIIWLPVTVLSRGALTVRPHDQSVIRAPELAVIALACTIVTFPVIVTPLRACPYFPVIGPPYQYRLEFLGSSFLSPSIAYASLLLF